MAGNLFVHSFVSSTLAPSTASFLQKINTSETMSAQLYFTFSGQPHASAVAVEFLAMYSESLWCWPRFMVFLQRARCGCDFHEQMASKALAALWKSWERGLGRLGLLESILSGMAGLGHGSIIRVLLLMEK